MSVDPAAFAAASDAAESWPETILSIQFLVLYRHYHEAMQLVRSLCRSYELHAPLLRSLYHRFQAVRTPGYTIESAEVPVAKPFLPERVIVGRPPLREWLGSGHEAVVACAALVTVLESKITEHNERRPDLQHRAAEYLCRYLCCYPLQAQVADKLKLMIRDERARVLCHEEDRRLLTAATLSKAPATVLARPRGGKANGKNKNRKPKTIWYHGDRSYSSDKKIPVKVSHTIHLTLQAFLKNPGIALDTATLSECVGNVSQTIDLIDRKFPGAVRRGKAKGDGYYACVRPVSTN